MEKDTLIVVLTNGTELLATVEEKQGVYLLSDVLQILQEMDEQSGSIRMGVVPYLPYSDPDGGIAVPTNMAIIAIPSPDMKKQYAARFSKIVMPESKIIV